MRKILITLLILIVGLAALWIFAGSSLAVLVDRFYTIQAASIPVQSISYEGAGDGGVLRIGSDQFNLAPADAKAEPPHIGSTKNDELALANGGKVFTLGSANVAENQPLISQVQ